MSNIRKEVERSSLSAVRSFTHPHPRRRYVLYWALVASAVAIVVAAAWPVTTLETPRWEVRVVDEKGQPVAGMTVRMAYRNYSAESVGHEQDLETDATGHVVFPARTITASLLRRGLEMLRSAQAGVHASFGPHVYVFAFESGPEGYIESWGDRVDWAGKPAEMESRIVVLRFS